MTVKKSDLKPLDIMLKPKEQKAILIKCMHEVPYGKNPYRWINGYRVIQPSGIEIAGTFRARSDKYERSAIAFCKANSWSYIIMTQSEYNDKLTIEQHKLGI